MRWLTSCVLLAAGTAFAQEAGSITAAKAWWQAAVRGEASAVEFRVRAKLGNKDVCPELVRGTSSDKKLQARLQACVRQIQKVELDRSTPPALAWEATKEAAEQAGETMPVKPGEQVAYAHKVLSGIDLSVYVATDAKGVVRRVWIAEHYFE